MTPADARRELMDALNGNDTQRIHTAWKAYETARRHMQETTP